MIGQLSIVIYNVKVPSSDGRQIILSDSICFIIQAIAPGSAIFDKTGEMPALAPVGTALQEKTHTRLHLSGFCDHVGSEYIEGAICDRIRSDNGCPHPSVEPADMFV